MEKLKTYPQTRFTADVIREAEQVFIGLLHKESEAKSNYRELGEVNEQWKFDSNEEFFAEYRSLSIRAEHAMKSLSLT